MLKLKIIIATLGVAGMITLLLGDTYLTTGLAVICTAVALPLSIHLAFRWAEGPHGILPRIFSVVWVLISGLMAVSVLQDIGITDIALSATIDPVRKVEGAGYYVSSTSLVSILLAVIVLRSPKCDNDSNDED